MKEKQVKLNANGMVADRDTIPEALEYFNKMLETVQDNSSKMAVHVGFNVFWNTLANNSRIYKREEIE